MLSTFYKSVFFYTLSNFILVISSEEIPLVCLWATGGSEMKVFIKSHRVSKFRIVVYLSFVPKELKIQQEFILFCSEYFSRWWVDSSKNDQQSLYLIEIVSRLKPEIKQVKEIL